MKTILLRRQDGLAKSVPIKCEGERYKRSGLYFRPTYELTSYAGDGARLLVCEEDTPDLLEKEPFVRILPGLLGHELFFGDLLFVHLGAAGDVRAFDMDDIRSLLEGTHGQWCRRNIRDVGQKEEAFVNEEATDEDEDESEDDERPPEDDDEDDNEDEEAGNSDEDDEDD